MYEIDSPIVADLFCGASGLGLGARLAGFSVKASVDSDRILTSSHSLNFSDGKLELGDVTNLKGSNLIRLAGGRLDGIIGGPPCQGFSEVGKADPKDPRRDLLRHFFRVVAESRPRFFMMENVRGLMFAKNRPMLDQALEQVPSFYKIIGPVRLDAAEFGAATSRPRVFVLGYDPSSVDNFDESDVLAARRPATTVHEAISDLQLAESGGEDSNGFDVWRFSGGRQQISNYAARLRSADNVTTGHRRTPHKAEVAKRFAAVPQGGMDKVGRHPRLAWSGQCPTLRAGTGADLGSFQAVRPLHPEEPRVITVREAARLQGFPDGFRFHPTVWHSFRMIGNSVSPVVAEAILSVVRKRMAKQTTIEAAE